jgi:cytochrome c peroxidase
MMVLVRGAFAIGCVVVGLWLSACTEEELVDGLFYEPEWKKIETFTPLPTPPASPTNRYADDDGAAALGQKLFFEKRYSGQITLDDPSSEGPVGESGLFSCASCHDPTRWFIDTRSVPNKCSVGAAQITKRNSPSMVNIAYYEWGGWAGAQDQFWKQGANSPETKDLNGDRLGIAHMIFDHYRAEYDAVFKDMPLDADLDPQSPNAARFPASGKPGDAAWDLLPNEDKAIVNRILANVGKAFEAYERRLISGNAPFDRYVAGDFSALNLSAKRGLKLFIGKAGCDSCHSDQTFTDQKFHNTAVAQATLPLDEGRYEDLGRVLGNPFNGAGEFSDDKDAGRQKIEGLAQTDDLRGQFRTKSLRHVAETGPYFHDGSVTSLEAVIRHYNQGGATGNYPGAKDSLIVPLNLSETEIADLVAFLRSLTGEPVQPELMVNPLAQ